MSELSRHGLTVSAVGWGSKAVRTGGITGSLHDEWRRGVRSEREVPFRALVSVNFAVVPRYSRR